MIKRQRDIFHTVGVEQQILVDRQLMEQGVFTSKSNIPAGDSLQMDMFIDNAAVVMAYDLRSALGERDLAKAAGLSARLHEQSHAHPEMDGFD